MPLPRTRLMTRAAILQPSDCANKGRRNRQVEPRSSGSIRPNQMVVVTRLLTSLEKSGEPGGRTGRFPASADWLPTFAQRTRKDGAPLSWGGAGDPRLLEGRPGTEAFPAVC
jgi:hypothetical protein